MMSNTNTGGPAFPHQWDHGSAGIQTFSGMTLRQYAAIKLKVPDSGTDWLDAMIRESLHNDFAAKALQSVWGDIPEDANRQQALDYLGKCCYEMADAMLKAREAK